ncbi:Platinum sensitivity protein, partial [Coemansia sp. RSA 486]
MDERANGSSPAAENEDMLPLPTMSSLVEIERIISNSSQSLYLRDKLVLNIVNSNFFEQLRDLHDTCEDLDATEELHLIYSIVRQMILLNDSSIFEHMIKQENIIGVVSILEHDPHQKIERGTFRNFLLDNTRYKEVVPIEDADIESKIHQTFRLQYLKDIVLPRILDDGTLPIINALLYFNHAQIANYLQHNQRLLKNLFGILHDSEDMYRKHDVVFFVRQFCSLAKSLPIPYRVGLFRTLSQYGLFSIFEYALQEDKSAELQVAGADVLLSVLEQDRALVRSYIIAQSRHHSEKADLMGLIIQGTKNKDRSDVRMQCCEVLRVILDTAQQQQQQQQQQQAASSTETFEIPTAENGGGQCDNGDMEDFIALFYGAYAQSAMETLLSLTAKSIQGIGSQSKQSAYLLFLCETLSTCVRLHGYRARSFVFATDIAKNISLLLQAKPNHLKLAALRFIRACVGIQDDSYNKYLIGHRLFDPIIALYLRVYTRDNLVSSACRELFTFIAANRIASLLSHLTNVHTKSLSQAKRTLDMLRKAYSDYLEQSERARAGTAAVTPTVGMGRQSALSINSLIGQEPQRHTQTINGVVAASHDAGTMKWVQGSAVDEMEDAYLETSDDDESDDSSAMAIS